MTVWAYADGDTRSLAMPAAVKRKAFATLKRRQITGARALVRLYTAALLLLLKDVVIIPDVVIEIDREYPGYDADIKAMLLLKFHREGADVAAETIAFAHIGKKAKAHDAAWQVFVGLKEPDLKVTWAEVEKVL
ncbi:MAG: hypothetical protein HY260_16135 [Chloroflexi bacterium]|nr:hypothetical protein [Chloroflexota bacterium]